MMNLMRLLNKALTLDNKRPQAYFYLGQLFEKRKEVKSALNAYKQ